MLSAFFGYSQCDPSIGTNPALLSGCEPFSVQFFDQTDVSNPATCIVQRREWNFGDGSPTSGTTNPVHSYDAGVNGDTTYTARLRILDQNNVWSEQTVQVQVFKKPEVGFTLSKDTVCALNETFCTSNNSESGPGYTYLWNFNPGFSSSYDTCFAYENEGNYDIQLSVTNANGCIASQTKPIVVNEIPNPDFNITPFTGCNPLTVNFDNITPQGEDFPITGWSWDFDGNGSSTIKSPADIDFEDPGLFSIQLTAINSAGCSNTTNNNFLVKETPTASISGTNEVCVGQNATLIYNGSVFGSPSASYTWSFDGGNIAQGSGEGPYEVNWDEGGTYTVTMEVEENGCTADTVFEVIVNDLPVVDLLSSADNDSICEDEDITFTASPANFERYIFYNNNVLVQDSVVNIYLTNSLSSPNVVSVTAVDSNQCASSASNELSITVLDKPEVTLASNLNSDSICLGQPVQFTASPSGYDSYEFFDGFESLQLSASNTLNTSALDINNEIKVVATNIGCTGEASDSIVKRVFNPIRKPLVNCGETNTNSIDFIWINEPEATGYEVSINGGLFEPTTAINNHTLGGLNPGDTAYAILRATGPPPCGNSLVSDTTFCIAQPCNEFTLQHPNYAPFCVGEDTLLSVFNIQTQGEYGLIWDNGSETTDSTFDITLLNDTSIEVLLIDSAQLGCIPFKARIDLEVNEIPTSTINFFEDTVCAKDLLRFEVEPAGWEKYQFYVNNVLLQDSANPVFTANDLAAGNSRLRVDVEEFNCSYSDSVDFFIRELPVVDINLSEDTVCIGDLMTFEAVPQLNRYEFYDYASGGSSFNTTNLIQDSISSTYQTNRNLNGKGICVIGEDDLGCRSEPHCDTIVQNIVPGIFLSSNDPDRNICEGDTAILNASTFGAGYDYFEFYNNYDVVRVQDSANYVKSDFENNHVYFARAYLNGCVSELSNGIRFTVEPPLQKPMVNCGQTGNGRIDFLWEEVDLASGYEVSVDGAAFEDPSEGATGLKHVLTGLLPNDTVRLRARALSNGACGTGPISDEVFCVLPCELVDYDQTPDTAICEGQTAKIRIYNIVSPSENFQINWGQGLTQDSVIFVRPTQDTTIQVTVFDTSQSYCTPRSTVINIEVDEKPEMILIGDTIVCSTESLALEARPRSGVERYMFYDNFQLVQDSIYPFYTDSTPENGHRYSVVGQNGMCYDTSSSVVLTVEPQLFKPQVNCGRTTTDSISFVWDSIPEINQYRVTVNQNRWRLPSTGGEGTLHQIGGLNAGDSVTIQVQALYTGVCGFSEVSDLITCYARDCEPMNFELYPDTLACGGDSIFVQLDNISTPSSNFAIAWDRGSVFGAENRLAILPSQDTTVYASLIDSSQLNCGVVTKFANYEILPRPVADYSLNIQNDSLCFGEILEVTANDLSFDNYQVILNDTVVLDSNYFSYSTEELNVGRHYLQMVVTDRICVDTSLVDSVEVISYPSISLSISDEDTSICRLDTVVFSASTGFDEYIYYLNGNIVQWSSDSIYSTHLLSDGDEVYVVGVNANLCERFSDEFVFQVTDIPSPTITSSDNDLQICRLDTVRFTALPALLDTFQFYVDDSLIYSGPDNQIELDYIQNQETVKVTAWLNGCKGTSSGQTFTVDFTPEVTIAADTSQICIGENVELSANGADSYSWSNQETGATVQVQPTTQTWYWVTGTVGGCTSRRDSIEIDVDEFPVDAYAGEDVVICQGEDTDLLGSGGIVYFWEPSDSIANPSTSSPNVSPHDSTVYYLTVQNRFCVGYDSVLVAVDLCLNELEEEVTDIITPNGDGTNDRLVIRNIWYFNNSSIKIYNRWSQLVYSNAPYLNEWEGQNNSGNPLTDGTYYYVLDLGNGREPYVGFVMIKR